MLFSGFSWTCKKKKKNHVSFALLWNLKYSLVPKKRRQQQKKKKKSQLALVRREKPSVHSSVSYFFCQWSHVFMLLKLDAGVCPSTLLKSHNKWRKWSKTTNYSETVGKKMPSDEVYFTFLICTFSQTSQCIQLSPEIPVLRLRSLVARAKGAQIPGGHSIWWPLLNVYHFF